MVIPYLAFQGNCSEVLAFYSKVFRTTAKRVHHYDDYVPEDVFEVPDNFNDWIMHAEMEICGTNFWFADEFSQEQLKNNFIKLVITVEKSEQANEIYNLLLDDGEIILPPTQTFYSTYHAAIIDKFGVSWNIVSLENNDE